MLFTSHPLLAVFLQEPGTLLFGILLMVMTAAVVLAWVAPSLKSATPYLMATLILTEILLLGILAFDFANTVNHVFVDQAIKALSDTLATHRWLIIQLPLLLIPLSCILLATTKDHLNEKHAKTYLRAMQAATTLSFMVLILIGWESLL